MLSREGGIWVKRLVHELFIHTRLLPFEEYFYEFRCPVLEPIPVPIFLNLSFLTFQEIYYFSLLSLQLWDLSCQMIYSKYHLLGCILTLG